MGCWWRVLKGGWRLGRGEKCWNWVFIVWGEKKQELIRCSRKCPGETLGAAVRNRDTAGHLGRWPPRDTSTDGSWYYVLHPWHTRKEQIPLLWTTPESKRYWILLIEELGTKNKLETTHIYLTDDNMSTSIDRDEPVCIKQATIV